MPPRALQHIKIDSTGAYTDMCLLGKRCQTDKSPYYTEGGGHRHPYTSVYSMLFSPFKNKEINFLEIGIADGGSALMWSQYFENANFYFFDFLQVAINSLKNKNIKSISNIGYIDVSIPGNVDETIQKTGKLFDVILDDSSHIYEDQIRVVKEAWKFVKPGGYLIVEDVQRCISEERFAEDLADIIGEATLAYCLECNHEERYSPDSNDDKMIVFIK